MEFMRSPAQKLPDSYLSCQTARRAIQFPPALMSMKIVTPQQIDATLAVTDSMSIHREAVVVPLGPEGQG